MDEPWRRIQDVAMEIDRLERESTEPKEELNRTGRQFDEYRRRRTEIASVRNSWPHPVREGFLFIRCKSMLFAGLLK